LDAGYVWMCDNSLAIDGDRDRCDPRWSARTPNSRTAGAIAIIARSLEDCQYACFNNPNCTGVDWQRSARPGRQCWLAGPWSGQLVDGTATGFDHYDITRPPQDCRGTSKPYIASPLLHRGGGDVADLFGWLVCCSGWAAFPGGPVGTVKSLGEPHSVGMSNCLVMAMWPNWRCSHVSGGSCALCYSCRDFQYPELLGTFWGWLMGPHSGLSLRGGTGYPAPHWNLERGYIHRVSK